MNLEIKSFKNFPKSYVIEEVTALWNFEMGEIFPISKELMERSTYDTIGFLSDTSCVAIIDNKIVGFIIAKVWLHPIKVEAYTNTGWISLIYVDPLYRKKGIGSALLNKVESDFKILGKEELNLGRDYQNFFPGIPMDLKSSSLWFEHRGFKTLNTTNDLVKHVKPSNAIIPLKPFKDGNDYTIRISNENDKEELKSFITSNWPGRWTVEVSDYIDQGPDLYFICLDKNNHICGFCRYEDDKTPLSIIGYGLTWQKRFEHLGSIGPLGVEPTHRNNNIAYNLLACANNHLVSLNVTDIMIDWTSLMDLYRKFGFEVWKSYIYTKKEKNYEKIC